MATARPPAIRPGTCGNRERRCRNLFGEGVERAGRLAGKMANFAHQGGRSLLVDQQAVVHYFGIIKDAPFLGDLFHGLLDTQGRAVRPVGAHRLQDIRHPRILASNRISWPSRPCG